MSIDLILAYCECGDVARAVDIGEQALAALADLEPPPDVSLQVELIGTLAGCYLERGDLTRAQLLTDRALTLSDQDGAPRARAAAAWNAAVIANGRHDSIGAREHADRALALYSEIDNARNVALLRVVSAALRLRQPEPDGHAALRDLERAMGDLHEVGSRVDFGYAHTLQAKAYLVIGDLARAEEAGRQALDDLSAGDRLQTGWAMLGLGRVAAARGDVDRAIELFTGAATALEETGASARQAGTAWRELGEACLELGRQQEGIDALRRASDLAGATYNPIAPCVRGSGAAVDRS